LYEPIENLSSAVSWNVTTPGSSSTLTGNNGGRMVNDTTSSSVRPSSWSARTRRDWILREATREERKALHVIPMQVRQKAVAAEQRVGGYLLAVVTKPRAHVEQQRILARRVDRNTRRIAAISSDVIALARRRTSNTVERDAHH
jgi:hypothetical protein